MRLGFAKRGNIHDVEISDSARRVLVAHKTVDLACFLVHEHLDICVDHDK